MDALRYDGNGHVCLTHFEAAPLAPGDVELRVGVAGICGTDLAAVGKGAPSIDEGQVLGHEFVAERCDDGRQVIVDPLIGCGTCELCTSGRDYICRRRQVIGIHRPGAFTGTIFVPASSVFDAAELTTRQAVMVEPMATALHACRLSGLKGRIAVTGAGAIGLCAVYVLRQLGLTDITITDPVGVRLDHASSMGAQVQPDGLRASSRR